MYIYIYYILQNNRDKYALNLTVDEYSVGKCFRKIEILALNGIKNDGELTDLTTVVESKMDFRDYTYEEEKKNLINYRPNSAERVRWIKRKSPQCQSRFSDKVARDLTR